VPIPGLKTLMVYEVTSGGRIRYVIDDQNGTIWMVYASPRPPKDTDRYRLVQAASSTVRLAGPHRQPTPLQSVISRAHVLRVWLPAWLAVHHPQTRTRSS
jgi:hypothetical protein